MSAKNSKTIASIPLVYNLNDFSDRTPNRFLSMALGRVDTSLSPLEVPWLQKNARNIRD